VIYTEKRKRKESQKQREYKKREQKVAESLADI
jgi:hypothetical protein